MKPDQTFGNQLIVAGYIAWLIEGHLRGSLTTKERRELDMWVAESEENLRLFEKLTDEDFIALAIDWQAGLGKDKKLEQVRRKLGLGKGSLRLLKRYWPYLLAGVMTGLLAVWALCR